MEANELLGIMQAEFSRVHESLNRIEDNMGNRQDALDERVREVEARTNWGIGAVKFIFAIGGLISIILACMQFIGRAK